MQVPTANVAITTISPNVTTTSIQIIGAKWNRLGFILYNNSANSCYINFGSTASSSGCSIIIPTFATYTWTMPFICYTGTLYAIRNAGTGTIVITEFIN